MSYFKHETALVASDVSVGEGTRVWAFVNIQSGAVVGRDCNICDSCFIEKGAVIRDRVTVKNGVSVFEGVTLEDDVFVGPNVAFVNDRFPRSRSQDWRLEPTVVCRGASLGANCTVMGGIRIGAYALVGAGAVIVQPVPAYALVVGNPARQIGWVGRNGKRLNDQLVDLDGGRYHLTDAGLEPVEGGGHG